MLESKQPSPAALSQTIWEGESGGFNIHWTQKDITATKGDKVVFSADEALVRKDFEKEHFNYTNTNEWAGFIRYDRIFTPLSIVGTIASMKDTFQEGGGGLVHGFSEFTTVNLANPDQVVSLTDFFGESVILKALLADSLIQKALADIDTPPSTLDGLYQVLKKAPSIVVRIAHEEDCGFSLAEDFLTQFAFHHIDKDRVAVRIALSPAWEACRYEVAQLGIYLPIPNKLKLALKKAQKGQAGFLMNNLKKMPKDQQTSISFATDTYMPYPVAGTRVTTVSNARLRTLPQIKNSHIVATLKKGTVLKTLARSSFQEDNRRYHRDYWYLIKLENGKIGWIFGALTKMREKAPLTSPRKTTGNEVRVRSAPNLFARIVETLDKGVIVHAFARSKAQDKIGDLVDYWYQVNLDDEKTGWIFGGLLMETEIRFSASEEKRYSNSGYSIYGRSQHQEKIGGILDYWYQVRGSSYHYYGTYYTNLGFASWIFGGEIMRIGTKITTTSGVRMRSEPNIKASLVNTLEKGVVVNAIARSTHQDNLAGNLDYWYQVKSVDGKIGWVFGGLLMSVSFSETPLYTMSDNKLNCKGTEPSWNMTISDKGIQYEDIEERTMNFPIFFINVSSNARDVWSIKAEDEANEKSVVLFCKRIAVMTACRTMSISITFLSDSTTIEFYLAAVINLAFQTKPAKEIRFFQKIGFLTMSKFPYLSIPTLANSFFN